METKAQHRKRRISEIKQRIEILENYIEHRTNPEYKQNNIGNSYRKQKNKTIRNLHNQRINQFKTELIELRKELKTFH